MCAAACACAGEMGGVILVGGGEEGGIRGQFFWFGEGGDGFVGAGECTGFRLWEGERGVGGCGEGEGRRMPVLR